MTFVAVCQFAGKGAFHFFAPTFSVETWADLEREGQNAVREAWAAIAPYDPPAIVEYLPGALVYEAAK